MRILVPLALAFVLAACTGGREDTTSAVVPSFALAGPDQIREHATEACMVVQGELMALPQELVRTPCRCYARRTVARMTEDEIASYRRSGLFDATAREKAMESLDTCRLERPV